VIAVNPRGIIYVRDELAGWYNNLERYSGGGSDKSFWLEAFGGRPYVVDRVKDGGVPVQVPRLGVSMLGGMQPDRLMEMVLAKDDGLTTRFLHFWPETTSKPFTEGVRLGDGVFEALQRLSEISMIKGEYGEPEPHLIPFTADARHYFGKWVDRHHQSKKEQYAGTKLQMMFGKANGQVARLALVIEFLWWCAATDDYDEIPAPKHVGIKAVRAAIEIRETYIVPMQRRVIGHGTRSSAPIKARAIATWIIEKRPDEVNSYKLRREAGIEGISGRTDPAELEDALAYLIELRWLTKETVKTKGRPLHRFVVNPRLYDLLDRRNGDRM
jgi:hypothetical protein